MNSKDIFDKVYNEGTWGRDALGQATSGPGSHTQHVVNPYIKSAKAKIASLNCKIIVDLGCGDFNVGKYFVDDCEKYIACDVSSVVLQNNRQKYSFENVEFRELNITKDRMPSGDLAFVRQVLQHLSNSEIESFIEIINLYKPFRYLLVTEHLPSASDFVPNLDMPTSHGIRVGMNSGIELHNAPFNLSYQKMENIAEVSEATSGVDALIRSTLYEL